MIIEMIVCRERGAKMVEYNPVGVVNYDREGNILFGERSDGKGWGFPGGKTDPGETSIDAAVREVEEETGIVVALENMKKLGDCITYDNDDGVNSYRKSSIYFCNRPVDLEEVKTTKEMVDFKWVSASEAVISLDLFMPTAQTLAFYSTEIKFLCGIVMRS